LFHFIQRTTLKKKHADHFLAASSLLNAICRHNEEDCEKLLTVLKNGTLSTKHTDDEIVELKASRLFRQRHNKHLRKEMRPPNTMNQMLDDWFDRLKCTSSNPETRPARGRLDPLTGDTLFTHETKEAIKNAKDKSACLQDPHAT